MNESLEQPPEKSMERQYAKDFCSSLNDTENRRWHRDFYAGQVAARDMNSDSRDPINLRELREVLQKELEAELKKVDGIDNPAKKASDEAILVMDIITLLFQKKIRELKALIKQEDESGRREDSMFQQFSRKIRGIFGGE